MVLTFAPLALCSRQVSCLQSRQLRRIRVLVRPHLHQRQWRFRRGRIRGLLISRCHPTMAFRGAFRTARPLSRLRKSVIFFSRRTGIRRTIHQCPKSSQAAGSPMCALAAPVTAQRELAVLKTRVLLVFLPPISCSKWLTTRAAPGSFRVRKEAQTSS